MRLRRKVLAPLLKTSEMPNENWAFLFLNDTENNGVSMVFYAYVLISEEGYHYTGSTGNLNLRILRHYLKTSHFTRKGTNWRIIYSKEFLTRSEAMKYEKWLKSGIGRKWLKENIAGWSPPQAE